MPINLIVFLCAFCSFILGVALIGTMNKSRIEELEKKLNNEGSTYHRILAVMKTDKSDKDKISDIQWEIDNLPF